MDFSLDGQTPPLPFDVTIERVEVVAVQIPLSRTFAGSVYEITDRTAIICRIHAGGLVGEGVNMIGGKELLPTIVRVVETEIAPMLVGRSASNIETCWQRMDVVTRKGGRDPRAAVRAVGAADTALWDLFAKALDMPLYRLWGGYRESVPVVAIGGYNGSDSDEIATEILELKALGVGGCKFKVGGDPAGDAKRLEHARRAAGDDFHLLPDANRGWSFAEAREFCDRSKDLNIRWLEEPCHWRNASRDNRAIRLSTGIPICAGQSEISGEGCRDLIIDGAIDVCNFDASWAAGPSEWRRVAGLAASCGVEMAHHGEPHLGAHLLGAIAHGTFAEIHRPDRDPLFHEMIRNLPDISGGFYSIPQTSGWGVDLDWDALNRWRVN